MDTQVALSIIGVIGTLGGSLGGAWIGNYSKGRAKKVKAQKAKIEKYRIEIAARIYLERVAMHQLQINKICNSEADAQQRLRRKVGAIMGDRPEWLTPAQVDLSLREFDDAFD